MLIEIKVRKCQMSERKKLPILLLLRKTVINFYMYVSIGFSAYITLTGY